MRQITVSDVARRLGARPKDISDLFYQRKLDDGRCPVVGGRRLIPEEYVHVIEAVLREHGRLEPTDGMAPGAPPPTQALTIQPPLCSSVPVRPTTARGNQCAP
jgi:hypothetical protein